MVVGPGDVFSLEPGYKNALSTTVTEAKATAGLLYGFYARNTAGAVGYLQLFDLAAADVVLGTTVPKLSFGFEAGDAEVLILPLPILFATAISMAGTTDAENSSAGNFDVNLFFA